MESNPTCPLCYPYLGMPQQTPQYFNQNQSPNIVINPTFSFITDGPPAKKPKLLTTAPIINSEEGNDQSSNKCIQGSDEINKNQTSSTDKDKYVKNYKKSTWASNLQNIGQSHSIASQNLKKPIVCIPDYGKNDPGLKNQNLQANKTSVDSGNDFNTIDNRVKSLLSSILSPEIEQKKSGIQINLINNDTSNDANCIDKTKSKLIAQSVIPSLSKFRIPKLKNNSPKDTKDIKYEKCYDTNDKTDKTRDKLKYNSVTTNNSEKLAQNSNTRTDTSILSLKTKAKYQSNPFIHHKRTCNVKFPTEHNEKQFQNIQKEVLYNVCKICNPSERLSYKTEKAKKLNKTEESLTKKLKMSTKRKLNLEVKEEQFKKDENFKNSLKQRSTHKTHIKTKTKTENDRTSGKSVTCQTETHFRYTKSKVIQSPKSPSTRQDETGNQPKHEYRIKMQNPHNSDLKSKTKKSNEHRDKDEESFLRRGNCNLFKEDIKQTKKHIDDDSVKNIPKRTTVKSIINQTNEFELNIHKKNKIMKFPVVEDLRKKLNRVKKYNVPNTIYEPDSVTENDHTMKSNAKESTTKTIKLVINIISEKSKSKHFETNVKNNETCQLTSLDLSFLDDINVDDIVKSLNYEETPNKLTNTSDQSVSKVEFLEAPKTRYTMATKHESTDFTNISKTKTADTYRHQEHYNKIIDNLTLSPSKNIKVECTATVFSSLTNLKQEESFDKVNEYRRSETDNIQNEFKKEIKREIIVLDEEQTIDTLFLTNNKIEKGNYVNIKTEINEVSLEPLSDTHNSITTEHSSNSNQEITFDTNLKDFQIAEEIHKSIKNEVITEIIVLDDDEPIRNTAMISNREEQEKEFEEEIIVLDEDHLTDTSNLKPNHIIGKENEIETKNECTEVNDRKLFHPLNTLSTQHFSNANQVTLNKITSNTKDSQTIPKDRDIKNELITEINVLNEPIFNKTIDSSIQQISNNHSQKQQDINRPQSEQHIACKVENTTEIITLLEDSVIDTISNHNIGVYCKTVDSPYSKNAFTTSIKAAVKLQQINDSKTNESVSKEIITVSKENQIDTEKYDAKNDSTNTLPLTSVSNSGSSKSVKTDLAIKEDTKDVSNIQSDIKQEKINGNQNESHIDSGAQNAVIPAGKINESKTHSLLGAADKYKIKGETFCKEQVQDGSLAVLKVSKIQEPTINSEIKPVGLPQNPCEKLLMQNVKDRMRSYLGINYDLELLIRRGKFSIIFQCDDTKNKTTYAIKILNKGQDRYTEGIQKEIMLKDLQKDIPNINQHCVYLFNGFGVDGHWCFLMEYYPKNLKEIISKNNECFHIDTVQQLSRQLVSAVTVLRNKNIVHSAIVPGHILINDTMNSLKLCGFDEARTVDQVVLLPNLGTASYRAPELILGYSDGFSIDVWSTALVMYEMATGRRLFPGVFNNDILYKQMSIFGNIPFDMVQSSIFKDRHFRGTHFMRIYGHQGKNIKFISGFYRKSVLTPNIMNSYYKVFAKTRTHKENFMAQSKLRMLIALLYKMLVLDPHNRLPIEFVYADPFIFKSFHEDCFELFP